MKIIIKSIIIAVLAYFGGLLFPWWIVALAAFVVGSLFQNKGFNSFLSGFLGVGVLWLVLAYLIDKETNSFLTEKVAELMGLSNTNYLILLTAFIGGLTAGFAALSGALFGDMFRKKRRKYF